MENLVDTLVEKISSQFSEEALKQINEPKDKIDSTLKKIPSVLVGALISQLSQPNKTSTLFKLLTSKENIAQIPQGASVLLKEFTSTANKTSNGAEATSASPESRNLVDSVLGQIFGTKEKIATFTDQFAKQQGIRPESMKTLFKSTTAFSLSQITKLMRDKGLGVVGFSELLTSQRRVIEQASPEVTKLISMITSSAAATTPASAQTTTTTATTTATPVAPTATVVNKDAVTSANGSTNGTAKIATASASPLLKEKTNNKPEITKSTKSDEPVEVKKTQEVDLKPPFPMWIFPLLILVGGGWLISQWYNSTGNSTIAKTPSKVQVAEANKGETVTGDISNKDIKERLEKVIGEAPAGQNPKSNEQLAMLKDSAMNNSVVAKDAKEPSKKLEEFAKEAKTLVKDKLAETNAGVKKAEKEMVAAVSETSKNVIDSAKAKVSDIKKDLEQNKAVKEAADVAKSLSVKVVDEANKLKDAKVQAPAVQNIKAKIAETEADMAKALDAAIKAPSAETQSTIEVAEISLPVVNKNVKTAKNAAKMAKETAAVGASTTEAAQPATYKLSVTKNGVAEKLHNYLVKNYETIKTLALQRQAENKANQKKDPNAKEASDGTASGLARADLNSAAFIDLPVEVINFDSIYFGVGSSNLKGNLKDIYQVSKVLESYDLVRIKLRGHTDSTGSKKANDKISLARANKLKAKLVTYGIDTKRIFAEGAADAFPVGDNTNPEGRKANRRVDVRVVE